MKIVVDEEKCQGSGRCVKVCPERAITLVGGLARVDPDRCDFDGLCIPACPHGAIRLEEGEGSDR